LAYSMGKRAAASRVSRNKKKYWRKGTDVGDVEEGLAKANFDKQNGEATVAHRTDDELFVVDREAREDVPDPMENLTLKKKGMLERIMKRVDEPIPEPKVAAKKPTIPKAKKTIIKRKEPKKIEAAKMDLWTTDLEAKVDLNDPDGARIYKETLKLTRVKQPRTVLEKPSLLRAVAIPDAGASYNPDVDDYSEFVSRLVEDEKKVLMKDEKARRRKELAPGEKMCTAEEYRREMMEGLGVLDEEKKEEAEDAQDEVFAAAPSAVVEDETMEEGEGKKEKKGLMNEKALPKTKKQRRKEREIELAERKKSKVQTQKELEQSVFKVKKLVREVREEEEAREAALKIKREHRAIAKATRRKRHGKGEFEDNMEEFLMAEELPSSMRQINPQGCIVSERFKSYQKRNMIPVPLEEKQWKKKGRLRYKIKEERQSKEIKIGTKLRA
ncbi:hypothetical protein PMAYCL1PPCAC_30100, partial [Pristionchus mayeri]